MALPIASTERVVDTFVREFHALVAAKGNEFHFGQFENEITARLAWHLQTVLADTLKSGFWDFELNQVREDMTDYRRLDITYSTVWEQQNTRLTFECKKLYATGTRKARQARRYYIDHGIHRFVLGSYAPMDPAGFMVGFVATADHRELKDVRASLSAAGTPVAMRLRDYGGNQYWKAPRALFADQAAFETCHLRASPYPEITLYHLGLAFA